MIRIARLVIVLLTIILFTSCGGGGGSSSISSSTGTTTSQIASSITSDTLISSSANLALNGSNQNIVRIFAVADFNNDGLQDVVFTGFAEPPNAQGSALVAIKIYYGASSI